MMEYRVRKIYNPGDLNNLAVDVEKLLNELAGTGWEPCHVQSIGTNAMNWIVTFQRDIKLRNLE